MDSDKMGLRPTSPSRPLTPDQPHSKHSFRSGMWQKLHHLFGRDESPSHHSPERVDEVVPWPDSGTLSKQTSQTNPCRRVGIGLPRQATFKRQNSERRERLFPVDPCLAERRAVSTSRHNSSAWQGRSRSTPAPFKPLHTSAPALNNSDEIDGSKPHEPPIQIEEEPPCDEIKTENIVDIETSRPPRPASRTSTNDSFDDKRYELDDRAILNSELDTRWILNLSMHFRDKSDREKFFVTYAEKPNKWRRVTISCDYRNAEAGSLEKDLKELQFQRDKSLTIYEAIRDSLLEIQFYDTVTNLKLETSDGRLHVHVTEDVNEIIPYPSRTTVEHILSDEPYHPLEVTESELSFEAHLSGFVYRVRHSDQTYIKKEIPGPDTVEEFLYEINALQALHDSEHVIKLKGIVMDDQRQLVKGLLIDYAERGAVVDLLYDHKGQIPWESRIRWARHAVIGLRDIHEEGYVQGDFTLSNIVVDEDDNAKIIDINRRGCPVGWEPPEIATKIASNQRISMYIGEKSDLYQLGMTLWALAMDDDEPERHDPPLSIEEFPSEVPEWFQEIVRTCLAKRPRDRLAAKELVKLFPSDDQVQPSEQLTYKPNLAVRTEKQYIDPSAAVERDDLERFSRERERETELMYSPESSRNDYTFTYPKSSSYDLDRDSNSSGFERGRRLPKNIEHLTTQERAQRYSFNSNPEQPTENEAPQIVSISPEEEPEYDELEMDGKPYLVSRGTFNEEELRILGDISDKNKLSSEKQSSIIDRSPSPFILTQNQSIESDITPRSSHTLLPSTETTDVDFPQAIVKPDPKIDSAQQKQLDIGLTSKEDSKIQSDPTDQCDAPVNTFPIDSTIPHQIEATTNDEKKQRFEKQNENINPAEEEFQMPRLAYADSGFHEPLHEEKLTIGDETTENDITKDTTCT